MDNANETSNTQDESVQPDVGDSNGNDDESKGIVDSEQPAELMTTNSVSKNEEPHEEDDLEEGELKDDDDDDDDDVDDENENKSDGEASRLKTSSSEEESPKRPVSSPSSSSSSPAPSSSSSSSPAPSSDSKEQSSSKSSSRLGSHESSSSRNNSSIFDKFQASRLGSARRLSEDRYRGRDRERENPGEKAAKLISMRTRLLEARSREIELKFQKNKSKITPPPPPPPPPTLSQDIDQKNLKMTVAKPAISYSENPNPPPFVESLTKPDEADKGIESSVETDKEKEKKKTKSKKKQIKEKEKRLKKKSKKKKKKSSSKKRKKVKSLAVAKKPAIELKPETPPEIEPPIDSSKATLDHQGPRTPPDNHVMTLNDEQIEWPSHLIRTTVTQPSITYSVNPDSVNELTNDDSKGTFKRRRRSTLTSPSERKRYKIEEKYSSTTSPPRKTVSPFPFKTDDDQPTRKYSYLRPYETDLNFDYRWYYNYFVNSLEMDHNQAQHQAYHAMISAGSYEQEALDRWLISRGFIKQSSPICDGQKLPATPTLEEIITSRFVTRRGSQNNEENLNDTEEKESSEVTASNNDENGGCIEKLHDRAEGSINLRPLKPEITIIKSQREIVLPNGQVLPPGTVQKIVHPYPKLDSELLGPYFDFF